MHWPMSQCPTPHSHLQDKLAEYSDEIFDLLENGAYIYFCGLKGMMPGIQVTGRRCNAGRVAKGSQAARSLCLRSALEFVAGPACPSDLGLLVCLRGSAVVSQSLISRAVRLCARPGDAGARGQGEGHGLGEVLHRDQGGGALEGGGLLSRQSLRCAAPASRRGAQGRDGSGRRGGTGTRRACGSVVATSR